MRDPLKGRAALRRGRFSTPGAEYFLTICTELRRTGLATPRVAEAILSEARAMDADASWHLRCAVVMPDHVHILIVLGNRLSLGQTIARFKAKTKSVLIALDASLNWERDFFDHYVRPDDDRLAIFLYIYLNPYRAGLAGPSDRWPWYWCCDEDWEWFKDHLSDERPVPEWLM